MIKVRIRKVSDKTEALERRVLKAAELGIDELADMFINDVRDHWSKESPSSPGNPPAIKTGNLDQSLFKERQGRDLLGRFSGNKGPVIFVRIDTTRGPRSDGRPEYGAELEDEMNRPFVEPAADRVSKQTGSVIKRKF